MHVEHLVLDDGHNLVGFTRGPAVGRFGQPRPISDRRLSSPTPSMVSGDSRTRRDRRGLCRRGSQEAPGLAGGSSGQGADRSRADRGAGLGRRGVRQGRRERAGELEDEAADLESKSIADERAATERPELSDLRDERADDLRKRAEEATARAKDAQRQVVEAREQADEWGATADKRLADAARLRAQGRTDDADVMKARAERANEAGIEQAFRAGELTRDVEAFTAQASQWQTEAAQLAQQADLLDDEAAALAASAKAADTTADKLQDRAAAQDRIADDIDERLEAGVATTIRIKDDVEGTDVTVQIPGRPPTEADLDPPPSSQPSSNNEPPAGSPAAPAAAVDNGSAETGASAQHVSMDDFEAPDQYGDAVAAAPTFDEPFEPQQDFSQPEPEPDDVDSMFSGMGGDDYTNP